MNKIIAMLGTSALALGVMFHGAEARKVSYEINGQRYTYDTNDRAQAAAARKRIEAAKAAEAAKAKAEEERDQNLLVRIFGSQTQRDADSAKERLEQAISEEDASSTKRRQARSERRRKSVEPVRAEATRLKVERSATIEPERIPTVEPARNPLPAAPVSIPNEAAQDLGIKSVSYDMESGIKTTFMADGSIHEEPFDTSILDKLVAAQGRTGSLAAFIEQLRKAAPEEYTGSITPKAPEQAAQAQ